MHFIKAPIFASKKEINAANDTLKSIFTRYPQITSFKVTDTSAYRHNRTWGSMGHAEMDFIKRPKIIELYGINEFYLSDINISLLNEAPISSASFPMDDALKIFLLNNNLKIKDLIDISKLIKHLDINFKQSDVIVQTVFTKEVEYANYFLLSIPFGLN